jgi:hypothetical protein
MQNLEAEILEIKQMIYVIRGHRVMLDGDLATLYNIETKRLNEQVRRNSKRFPCDFMFQLSPEEYHDLKSQKAASKVGRGGKQKLPLVFTENGVAMLSSVLSSDRAIEVNISIMRIFTKLRSFHALESKLTTELNELKNDTNQLFKVVFERLDTIEDDIQPKLPKNRRKIGLKIREGNRD